MNPTIAILGRANVGKSTLFNRLTRTRKALVADRPALTRDRQVGFARLGERAYLVVDTGGLCEGEDTLAQSVAEQSLRAAASADAIILLVDGRAGLTGADREIAERLRTLSKPVVLGVNKLEGMDADLALSEFHQLGIASIHAISANNGDGVPALIREVLSCCPASEPAAPADREPERIRVAVIGRPNAGKSTLVNRIFGDQRVVTSELPGTTRDSIEIPFERREQAYLLIDTAGLRRRSRVTDAIEKFSIVKTLQAIDRAHVVLYLIDAREGVTEQDASLLGLVLESGRSLVIAVNKWDGLGDDRREQIRRDLDRRLRFVDFAPIHEISALHGSGVGDLFDSLQTAFHSAFAGASTAALNQLLREIVQAHPPPVFRGHRIKLRYAHFGGHNPPRLIIHGNQVTRVPESYVRYLQGAFRSALKLAGTPIRIEFRQGENPFKTRKNRLNPRQLRKRQRLFRHVRRGR